MLAAVLKDLMLIKRGLVNPELVISHRFPLARIEQAVETMAGAQRNKVIINP